PDDAELSGLSRAMQIGMLVEDGDEFVAPVPAMVEIGAELVSAGVPLGPALDVAEAIFTATDELARKFVALFLSYVWGPFEQAGEPPEHEAEMAEVIRRQRPLAVKALAATIAAAV